MKNGFQILFTSDDNSHFPLGTTLILNLSRKQFPKPLLFENVFLYSSFSFSFHYLLHTYKKKSLHNLSLNPHSTSSERPSNQSTNKKSFKNPRIFFWISTEGKVSVRKSFQSFIIQLNQLKKFFIVLYFH